MAESWCEYTYIELSIGSQFAYQSNQSHGQLEGKTDFIMKGERVCWFSRRRAL